GEGFDKIVAAMAKSVPSDAARDLLIRTATLAPIPPSFPTADPLVTWAEQRAKDERNSTRICCFHTAWAYYRACQFAEALTAARGDPPLAHWYRLVEPMPTFKLGRAHEARRLLDEGEKWYSERFRIALTATSLELPRDLLWEDWLRFQLERKEAFALITGKAAPENPWWHLFRGRSYLALGRSEKANAELQ